MEEEKKATEEIGTHQGAKLREHVYHRLHERLLSGEYSPGDVLNQKQVAKEFGVSMSPVREALQRLSDAGYLRVLPRTGYLVTSMSATDLIELAHVRALLEGEAAWQATSRITPAEIEELKSLQDEAEAGGDTIFTNRRFHMVVAHAAGNSLAEKMIGDLLDRSERTLRVDPRMSGSNSGPWHRKLIESFESRDREAARAWMRDHIVDIRMFVDASFPDSGPVSRSRPTTNL